MHYIKSCPIPCLLIFLMIWTASCTEPEASPASEVDSPSCLSESMMEMITVEEVQNEQTSQHLQFSGEVSVNSDKVYRVYPAAGGVVSSVLVRLGDQVEKGQTLATVQSPDIAEFHRDEIAAKNQRNLAENNLRLAESLLESGVYSQRDLMEAESSLESAQAELERIRQRQQVLGIEEGESVYHVKAPDTGFVVERNINPGINMRSGREEYLFKISDLSEVWVIANVYERDIHQIDLHDQVEVTVPAWPGSTFSGEIVRISNVLDPNRRVLEAIIELPNPDFRLKPGMYATSEVISGGANSRPAVHSESLIFDNNQYYVLIYNGECDLEIRSVDIYDRGGNRVYIGSGLDAGETIISRRQLLVYNELIN